jgi:hypothetical protein
MRHLMMIFIFVMATGLTQAKEAGEARPASSPRDSPKSSATTPDKLLLPQDARDKARGKTVETVIPDICKGC